MKPLHIILLILCIIAILLSIVAVVYPICMFIKVNKQLKSIQLITGPTGPVGPQGPQGPMGGSLMIGNLSLTSSSEVTISTSGILYGALNVDPLIMLAKSTTIEQFRFVPASQLLGQPRDARLLSQCFSGNTAIYDTYINSNVFAIQSTISNYYSNLINVTLLPASYLRPANASYCVCLLSQLDTVFGLFNVAYVNGGYTISRAVDYYSTGAKGVSLIPGPDCIYSIDENHIGVFNLIYFPESS